MFNQTRYMKADKQQQSYASAGTRSTDTRRRASASPRIDGATDGKCGQAANCSSAGASSINTHNIMKKTIIAIIAIALVAGFFSISAIAEAATDGRLSLIGTIGLLALVAVLFRPVIRKANKMVEE